MIVPNAKVYRGGDSQELVYPKPYEVNAFHDGTTLNLRFRTNSNGSRKSVFMIAFEKAAYPALLNLMAEHIASDSPVCAAVLKTISLELAKSYSQKGV